MEMTTILLAVTLVAQAILFCFTAVSWAVPTHRVWPPPSRHSWQLHATWFLSWVSLSGVFLLALSTGNSLGLPSWLRFGLGVPLLGLGILLIAWAFRALSVPATLGLPGAFIRDGPYRFSRNPQYLGTCLYLAALVVLSGSHVAAIGCLAVGLWFMATPFVEEPWLVARYGADYEAYRRAVPRFFGLRPLRAPA
jgi:protein-S-isoprenylcysteine O-methyltransferase Ste14